MNGLTLSGVVVPLVTPFDQWGQIDAAAMRRLVEFVIAQGVHGVFPGGTTGEGPLLALDERCQIAEVVIEAVAGRVPVIIHTGAASLTDTLALTRHAWQSGAQAAAVVTPYYYRLDDEALFQYYEQVAASAPDLPIFLYNIPQLTGNALSAALIARLVERCPNIVGLKDSSGSLATLFACIPLRGYTFHTFNGSDALILAGVMMGMNGCVSGHANIVPELVVALYKAAVAGAVEQARALQRQLDLVRDLAGDGGDLSLFKALLAKRDVPVGPVRPPLRQVPEAVVEQCWHALSALGVPGLAA